MALIERLDEYFHISAQGSNIRTEIRAGVTTFLTMSYILFVNPSILSEAIQLPNNGFAQLMTATALAAAFGSLMMGLIARYPFALAPGMGLNAYFAYSVVLSQGIPWQTALGAVFLSGILFLIISLLGIRALLIDAIPRGLKFATTAGIGCFLAMIGLKNGGLIVNHEVTLVAMGPLSEPGTLIMLLGLIVTVVLLVVKIKGAILIGILFASLVAMISQAPIFNGAVFTGFENGIVQAPVMPTDLFLAMDLSAAFEMGVLAIVFTFLFVDFFDSAGTLIALTGKDGRIDDSGNMRNAKAAFAADAAATSVGAVLGTSSTTSYIESASGIEEGGRTGLTAVVTGLLFLVSLILWPLAGSIPAQATAPALVIIGAMMMFTTSKINWNDYSESIPSLLIVLGMPLTFSITNGLSLGLAAYCLIKVCSKQHRDVHPLMYLLTLLLIVRFYFLTGE